MKKVLLIIVLLTYNASAISARYVQTIHRDYDRRIEELKSENYKLRKQVYQLQKENIKLRKQVISKQKKS